VTTTPTLLLPTSAGAKDALDAHFARLKADGVTYMAKSGAADGTKASNDTKKAIFKEVFQKSLAYTDPSTPEQAAQDMAVADATWFLIDPVSTIATDKIAFKVSDDTATVLATSFKWYGPAEGNR
jgi:hypothetical protein